MWNIKKNSNHCQKFFFDPLIIGRIPKESIEDFRLQYIKYYDLEKFHLKDLPIFSLYPLEERRSALICTKNDIFNEQLRAILKENAFQLKVAKLQDEILVHLENEPPDLLVINFDDFVPLENLIQVFKNRPFYKNSSIRLGIKDFTTGSIFQKLTDLREICNLVFSLEELKEKLIHSIGSQIISSIFVSNVNCQKDIFLWKKNLNNKYVDIDIDRFDFSLFEEMERKEHIIKVKRIFEWLL